MRSYCTFVWSFGLTNYFVLYIWIQMKWNSVRFIFHYYFSFLILFALLNFSFSWKINVAMLRCVIGPRASIPCTDISHRVKIFLTIIGPSIDYKESLLLITSKTTIFHILTFAKLAWQRGRREATSEAVCLGVTFVIFRSDHSPFCLLCLSPLSYSPLRILHMELFHFLNPFQTCSNKKFY